MFKSIRYLQQTKNLRIDARNRVKSAFGRTYKTFDATQNVKLFVLNQIFCRELIEETLSGNGFLDSCSCDKTKISLLFVDYKKSL